MANQLNESMQARIGMSYGEAYTPLPGDVPWNSNPFGEYAPNVGLAWQGPDGDVWKVDAPSRPLPYLEKGGWPARLFAALSQNTVMARAQVFEKPGLETVPITSNAVTFDVAYPVSNYGPWLYAPQRSALE